ncbi:type III-B CRISPR module-associated protein Cmr5 [Thermoflavimicrobium dichotomicum]|uniref:type III-B CRISPR module-associated protein Cmr5 n=1 Tax=Thermoflavimicrobium dichotomicum TaxID=46223 RepID=UPI000B87855B|nr:type III-B CRISPR module-associated protein Cmr5 [Thermoflavimicrobium dichotomicum]
MDILYNGLGQALAKQVAKAARDPFFQENPSYWLYADLQDWLCSDHPQSPFQSGIDLLDAIRLADPRTYRIAVYEAMAWLKWHKQFAYAYLKRFGKHTRKRTPQKTARQKESVKKARLSSSLVPSRSPSPSRAAPLQTCGSLVS